MSEGMAVVAERGLAEIECAVRVKTQALKRNLVVGICDIAADLLEAKAQCPHGQWGDSLKRMGYSSSTFSNYVKIYEKCKNAGISGANLQTFESLEHSKALALLALPDGKEAEFLETVDVENVSVRELKAEVKRYKDAEATARNQAEGWRMRAEQAKADADSANRENEILSERNREFSAEADDLRKANDELSAERRDLQAQVNELKSRPVEVAVQTIDATAEQLAAAEKKGRVSGMKEAAEKLETVNAEWQAQVDGLKAKLKEASENAPPAGDDARRAGEINATFKAIVTSTNLLLSMLENGDDAVRERLAAFFTTAAEKVKG